MIHGFLKNLLSSIWKREMSKLIKREGMIANVRKTQDDNKLQDDNLKRDKCIMCGAFHDLDDCSVFMSQTVQSQTKVLFKNECCYGCYVYISNDHSARTCKQQRSWKLCKKKHPAGLHGLKPKKISDRKQGNGKDDNKLITNTCTDDKSLSYASTRLRSGVISMCVVPVQIFH